MGDVAHRTTRRGKASVAGWSTHHARCKVAHRPSAGTARRPTHALETEAGGHSTQTPRRAPARPHLSRDVRAPFTRELQKALSTGTQRSFPALVLLYFVASAMYVFTTFFQRIASCNISRRCCEEASSSRNKAQVSKEIFSHFRTRKSQE